LQLEADKVSTARLKAISQASSKLQRTVAHCSYQTVRGNNRIDGLKNLIEDPRIGLIFFAPGVNETYRVNGRARICHDAQLKRRFAGNGKELATAMIVTVEETFGPIYGSSVAAVALKACRRWVTS
jgi:predicted pyridoxine 5'-phosphate oxidase superfamily flavin-nucleotide-binding protein